MKKAVSLAAACAAAVALCAAPPIEQADYRYGLTRVNDVLAKECARRGVHMSDIVKPEYYDGMLKKYGFQEFDDICGSVGYGGMAAVYVVSRLIEEQKAGEETAAPPVSVSDIVSAEQRLSQRRAESVVRYLIEHGIEEDRLSPVGYGEGRPKIVTRKIAENNAFLHEGDTLTEAFILAIDNEEYQEICNALNRRTEFRVLRTTYGLFDHPKQSETPAEAEPARKDEGSEK